MKKIFFAFCILTLAACTTDNDDDTPIEPSAEVQAILDKGVTLDTIVLDYATMYLSQDNFPIIKPNPIDQFVSKNEVLVYFEFVSKSREVVEEYFRKLDEQDFKNGFISEYLAPYYDVLESLSIEIKKNDDEFIKIDNDQSSVKIFPTAPIKSQLTFGKHEMNIDSFIERYQWTFPDYFVISFNGKETTVNTYTFRTTFEFNNNKKFVLTTDSISF
ncbi:MAG: hypothetical protein KDC49_22590 [Saprospiraceae bacterium]|nr:hypothetical protein [Saprospiraceae bacterium]